MSVSSPRNYDHSDFPLKIVQQQPQQSTPPQTQQMYVIKRNGKQEPVSFDKISARNASVAKGLNIDVALLTQKVNSDIVTGMTTREIDALSWLRASYLGIYNPDYDVLAARICFNDLQKSVPDFLTVVKTLNAHPEQLITNEIKDFVMLHKERILKEMDFQRDNLLDLFAGATFKNSYLREIDGVILECPQYMFMRVALGLWGPDLKRKVGTKEGDIDEVITCYHNFSQLLLTQATPTLTHAGSLKGNLASCYLQSIDDTLDSWGEGFIQFMKNSKGGGGVCIDLTPVRHNRAPIAGGTGFSNGIIPLMKILNDLSVAISQHDGKRRGAVALTIQPWHPDILAFLHVRLTETPENAHVLDAFPSLMCPDIFFKRIEEVAYAEKMGTNKENVMWSTFCPKTYPELITLYGEAFEKRYLELEKDKKFWCQYPMVEILEALCNSHMLTGLPYMSAKDTINERSNQKNIGTITSSNLCQEIVQWHSATSIASCNLASVCLPRFVRSDGSLDFALFRLIVRQAVKNLNRVVDSGRLATPESIENALLYRTIGVGPQGVADLFAALKLAWEDSEAKFVNQIVWEAFYYYAYEMSNELAKRDGPYSAFEGSPASQGILHYDMCKVTPKTSVDYSRLTDEERSYRTNPASPLHNFEVPLLDWDTLKSNIKKYGLRNSLLLCCMPCGQTSSIMRCSEGIHPYDNNLFSRKVAVGSYMIRNKYLYKELQELGFMNDPEQTKDMIDSIIEHDGSVQHLTYLPRDLLRRYKTARELSQKIIIDLAADRGNFCCQSQSMNIFMKYATPASLTSMILYGWKAGLKTVLYYLRTQATTSAIQYSSTKNKALKKKKNTNQNEEQIEAKKVKKTGVELLLQQECSLLNKDECLACQ